jgi:uncharacterized protein YprB with RNaseH-like and TPR domain
MDIREQVGQLRQIIEGVNARYRTPPSPRARREPVNRHLVEDLFSGQVVHTPHGSHFETERLFHSSGRHGSYEISALAGLPDDLLSAVSDRAIACCPPGRWLFLDTETTGDAGGSGTCAFLIGAGSIGREGFRIRQFFMRDYSEEASVLHALAEYMTEFEVVITYNGRSYDQPLLEKRYEMRRARHPFARLEHLDLLYGARRLFRARLESCRLVNLESRILGFERQDDIPGEMIPYCYFEYLRSRSAIRLAAVFHHNALDIVSLACLTGVIPEAFRDPVNVRARHGSDLLGLARWLESSGRLEEARCLLRRAVDMGLPDEHLFAALFAAGQIEKKLGLTEMALATFMDLSLSPNPYRARAYEEMARHYEHRERRFPMAIECARAARRIRDSEALRRREERLEKKAARASRGKPVREKKSAGRVKNAAASALTGGLL